MIIVSLLVSIYYNMIIAWCLLYMFESFRKDVPWKTCDNDWNTKLCAYVLSYLTINQSIIRGHDIGLARCRMSQICPEMQVNETHALYDKHHKLSSSLKSHQNTHNSVKCEVI